MLCLSCALRGKKNKCAACLEIAPKPLHLKVADIIASAAREHNAKMAADAEMFRKDFKGDAHQKILDDKARARLKKRQEKLKAKHQALIDAARAHVEGNK